MEIISNLDLILYLNLLLMANQFMVGGYKEDMCCGFPQLLLILQS